MHAPEFRTERFRRCGLPAELLKALLRLEVEQYPRPGCPATIRFGGPQGGLERRPKDGDLVGNFGFRIVS